MQKVLSIRAIAVVVALIYDLFSLLKYLKAGSLDEVIGFLLAAAVVSLLAVLFPFEKVMSGAKEAPGGPVEGEKKSAKNSLTPSKRDASPRSLTVPILIVVVICLAILYILKQPPPPPIKDGQRTHNLEISSKVAFAVVDPSGALKEGIARLQDSLSQFEALGGDPDTLSHRKYRSMVKRFSVAFSRLSQVSPHLRVAFCVEMVPKREHKNVVRNQSQPRATIQAASLEVVGVHECASGREDTIPIRTIAINTLRRESGGGSLEIDQWNVPERYLGAIDLPFNFLSQEGLEKSMVDLLNKVLRNLRYRVCVTYVDKWGSDISYEREFNNFQPLR